MKKVLLILCMVGIFNHEQVAGMNRSLMRFGASSIMAVSVAILCRNKSWLQSVQEQINPLDKEVIIQFYQENPQAHDPLYQTLKHDAIAGKINWFDRYRYSSVRHVGRVNSYITMASQSPHTQCGYQFDYDPQTGQDVLTRYDCRTCLNHKILKQCIVEGISESRIK